MGRWDELGHERCSNGLASVITSGGRAARRGREKPASEEDASKNERRGGSIESAPQPRFPLFSPFLPPMRRSERRPSVSPPRFCS